MVTVFIKFILIRKKLEGLTLPRQTFSSSKTFIKINQYATSGN